VEVWKLREELAGVRETGIAPRRVAWFCLARKKSTPLWGDEVNVAWTPMFADGTVSCAVIYGHFLSGSYVRSRLGTSADRDWGDLQLWTNFYIR
jgi:hypothetical protein